MNSPRKLILATGLCPGDVMTLTAAVESLHRCHPEKFLTDVRTCAREIWEHNPRITPIENSDGERLELNYPSVNRSNQESRPFLAGYMEDLAGKLGVPISLKVNKPQLYLSKEEKGWINQVEHHFTGGRKTRFMVLNAGIKPCYPAKAWPIEYYADVVKATAGVIQWVQIGADDDPKHEHPVVPGAINLIGQTTHRQLIRLVWHSIGGLGPITYLQHICAAWDKPYICLVGGREPSTWVQYPLQQTLHTMGMLPCCRDKACWKSKVEVKIEEDRGSLCERPVFGMSRVVPQCMAMIEPDEVVRLVRRIVSC